MQSTRIIAGGMLAAILIAALSVSAVADELESAEDRISYTIGMDIGRSLAEQDMDLNLDLLIEALQATFHGEETRMTQEEALAERDAFMQQRQQQMESQHAEEAVRNLEQGQAFLAENRERAEVTETASGLQYRVIEEGTGSSPAETDRVTVHYRGTLIDGTEFDSSYGRGEPATFALNQVIPGWTEGVQLMQEGGTYEFFIPADLAYGDQGRPGPIGPNATLVFEVELIEVHDD